MKLKQLDEYQCYAEVPLEHLAVLFRCANPDIICGNACGPEGCLGDEISEACESRRPKGVESGSIPQHRDV